MSNKKILQGHNKALESLATIAGIPIKQGIPIELFNCSKIAVDEITFASNVASNTEINHSLGEIPRYVFLLRKNMFTSTPTTYNTIMSNISFNPLLSKSAAGYSHYYSSIGNFSVGSYSMSFTENTIKCQAVSSLYLNGAYTVITMA